MPRVSEEYRAERRTQILVAAWRCFARNGFHATSMDDVIREVGLSAGAVYGYFTGKEQLIVAAAEEALTFARTVFADLLAGGSTPSPTEAVERAVTGIEQKAQRNGYDLTRLGVQVWSEALRNPAMMITVQQIYGELRGNFAEVVRRWQAAGQLAADADPDAAAQALFGLLLGFIVQRLILGDVDAASYVRGLRPLMTPPAI